MQIAIGTHPNKNVDDRFVEDLRTDMSNCSSDQENLKSRISNENVHDSDVMIILLKKEIESALKSLKEVQAEMDKLHEEKKEMLEFEQQGRKSMKSFTTQALKLQATMNDFENHSKLKMEGLSQRLQAFERAVLEAGSHWYHTKEVDPLDVQKSMLFLFMETSIFLPLVVLPQTTCHMIPHAKLFCFFC